MTECGSLPTIFNLAGNNVCLIASSGGVSFRPGVLTVLVVFESNQMAMSLRHNIEDLRQYLIVFREVS